MPEPRLRRRVEPKDKEQTERRLDDLSQVIVKPIYALPSSTRVAPGPLQNPVRFERVVESRLLPQEIENLDPLCRNLKQAVDSLRKNFETKVAKAKQLAERRVLFSNERISISFDSIRTGIDENGAVFVVVSDKGWVIETGKNPNLPSDGGVFFDNTQIKGRPVDSEDLRRITQVLSDTQGINVFTESMVQSALRRDSKLRPERVFTNRSFRPGDGALWLFQGQAAGEMGRTWTVTDFGKDGDWSQNPVIDVTTRAAFGNPDLLLYYSVTRAKPNSYLLQLARATMTFNHQYQRHLELMSSTDSIYRDRLVSEEQQSPPDLSSSQGTGAALIGGAEAKKEVNAAMLLGPNLSWVGSMNVLFSPIGEPEKTRTLLVGYSNDGEYTIVDTRMGLRGTGKSLKKAMEDFASGDGEFSLSGVGTYYYRDFILEKGTDGKFVKTDKAMGMAFTHDQKGLDKFVTNFDKAVGYVTPVAAGLGLLPVPIPYKMVPLFAVWGYDVMKKSVYDNHKAVHHLGSNMEIGSALYSSAFFGVSLYLDSKGLGFLGQTGASPAFKALAENPKAVQRFVEVVMSGAIPLDIYLSEKKELGRAKEEVSTSWLDWTDDAKNIRDAYHSALVIAEHKSESEGVMYFDGKCKYDPVGNLGKIGRAPDYEKLKQDIYSYYFGDSPHTTLRDKYVDALISYRASFLAGLDSKTLQSLSEKLGKTKDRVISIYLWSGGPADSPSEIVQGPGIPELCRRVAENAVGSSQGKTLGLDAGTLPVKLQEDYLMGYWPADWAKAKTSPRTSRASIQIEKPYI